MKLNRIGKYLIKGMRDFVRKLRSGVPIEATRIERYETPDGPMHVRKHVVLVEKENKP